VCYRMADHVSQEPQFLALSVSRAVVSITDGAAEAILDARDVTPAVAATLRSDLDRLQIVRHFERALLGERAADLDLFHMVDDGELDLLSEVILCGSMTDGPNGPVPRAISSLLRPYWRFTGLSYLRYFPKLANRVRQPYRLTARMLETDAPSAAPLCQVVFAAIRAGDAAGRRDETIADLDILRTGLALKLFKRAHGSYPVNLEALGSSRARDVFSGRDFVYRRASQGFRLYSIGMNLRDDGGIGRQQDLSAPATDTDDVVWDCVR
jgi:hypothetical protein